MRKLFDRIIKEKVYLIALIIITIGFHICYDLKILLPGNINWLLSVYHDWGQHYLGWDCFRDEPWQFPIGHISNYNFPAGTNVGFTDSIPLLAIFFKIFSALLPDNFQYFGLWLFSCHLLTGFFTIKILNIYKIKNIYILFGVFLVALNPVLIFRGLHPALCAHWLILASLYYYLKETDNLNVRKINQKQIIILILSSLINPYLFLMVVGFNFILPFKNYFYDKLISLKQTLIYIATALLSVISGWFLVGMISFNSNVNMEVVSSYGLYGFNLNSFLNSRGFSTINLPLKEVSDRQYEGFMYLGVGVMLLIIIATLAIIWKIHKTKMRIINKNKFLLPLLLLSISLSLFAITNHVSYNEKVLFIIPIPEIIEKLGSTFRASGRFFWVSYYILLFLTIIAYTKIKISDYIKGPVLFFLICIQIYDTKIIFIFRDLKYGDYHPPLSEKKWSALVENSDEIITYPPFDCNLLYPMDYQDLMFIVNKYNKPISTGYVARETGIANKAFLDSIDKNLSTGIITEKQIFITTPKYLDNFKVLLYKKKAILRYLDGYYYLYPSVKKNKIFVPKTVEEKHKLDSINKIFEKDYKLQKMKNLPQIAENIRFNIEGFNYSNEVIHINGWAFRENVSNSKGDSIYICFHNKNNAFISSVKTVKRSDLASAFGMENLEDSGFSSTIFTNTLENGKYDIAIAIKSKKGEWLYSDLKKKYDIGENEYQAPKIIGNLPSTGKIISNIEVIDKKGKIISIEGWAAFEGQNSADTQIYFILKSHKVNYLFETVNKIREDVSVAFNNKYNYANSGFTLKIDLKKIRKGTYTLGVLLKNTKNKKEEMFLSEKELKIIP